MRLHRLVLGVALISTVVVSPGLLVRGRSAAARVPLAAKQFAPSNNAFALDLFSRLSKEPGNLVVSTYSVDAALAMGYVGARGHTAEELAKVLHSARKSGVVLSSFAALRAAINDNDTSGCELVLANSLWGQRGYPFKRSFRRTIRGEFDAYLGEVDFQRNGDGACQEINAWVAAQTHGKIGSLISPGVSFDAQTVLVLVNGVYFSGSWATPFDAAQTKDSPFLPRTGETVGVPTMNLAGEFRYAESATVQVLEMPYAKVDPQQEMEARFLSNRFSMVILLPKKADGVYELEQSLTVSHFDELRDKTEAQWVMVALPRFKINCGFSLKATLQAMGVVDAFSETRADFSGVAGRKPLFVQDLLHRTVIEVDEKGTEAGAASALFLTHGGNPHAAVFNANHPFLFLIRHNPTGTILFLGRVENPLHQPEVLDRISHTKQH